MGVGIYGAMVGLGQAAPQIGQAVGTAMQESQYGPIRKRIAEVYSMLGQPGGINAEERAGYMNSLRSDLGLLSASTRPEDRELAQHMSDSLSRLETQRTQFQAQRDEAAKAQEAAGERIELESRRVELAEGAAAGVAKEKALAGERIWGLGSDGSPTRMGPGPDRMTENEAWDRANYLQREQQLKGQASQQDDPYERDRTRINEIYEAQISRAVTPEIANATRADKAIAMRDLAVRYGKEAPTIEEPDPDLIPRVVQVRLDQFDLETRGMSADEKRDHINRIRGLDLSDPDDKRFMKEARAMASSLDRPTYEQMNTIERADVIMKEHQVTTGWLQARNPEMELQRLRSALIDPRTQMDEGIKEIIDKRIRQIAQSSSAQMKDVPLGLRGGVHPLSGI